MPIQVICDNCGKAVVRSPSMARAKTLFCSPRCTALFHARKRQINAAERFWSKVAIRSPEECWEWTRSRDQNGYGCVGWLGKTVKAQRIALSLTDGIWDSPLNVCHTCDNPPCCNPAHLWRGTDLQNTRDAMAKGRALKARGERNASSKLTAADILIIRSSALPTRAAGTKFGVSSRTISEIRQRKGWSHVP